MVGRHNQPQAPLEVPNPTLDLRWCQLIGRVASDNDSNGLRKCLKVVAPIDHLVINLFCEENPGAPPRVERKCQENPQTVKRDFWLEPSNGCGSAAVDIVDTRCGCQIPTLRGRLSFSSKGVWYVLQNCFFIGILCFNLSMTKMFRLLFALSKNVARRNPKTCCSMVNPAEQWLRWKSL